MSVGEGKCLFDPIKKAFTLPYNNVVLNDGRYPFNLSNFITVSEPKLIQSAKVEFFKKQRKVKLCPK